MEKTSPWQRAIGWFRKDKKELPHEAILEAEAREPGLDVFSPTWLLVDKWARDDLQKLREQNDSPSLDAVKTAQKRGEIRRLKALIALPKKMAEPKGVAQGLLHRQ